MDSPCEYYLLKPDRKPESGIPCEDCGASAGVPCACDSAPYTDGEPANPFALTELCPVDTVLVALDEARRALNATEDAASLTFRVGEMFGAGGAQCYRVRMALWVLKQAQVAEIRRLEAAL